MSDKIRAFPEPQLTIRVTDDPDELADFDARADDPTYDGPLVLTADEHAQLAAAATAVGQSLQTFLRKQVQKITKN